MKTSFHLLLLCILAFLVPLAAAQTSVRDEARKLDAVRIQMAKEEADIATSTDDMSARYRSLTQRYAVLTAEMDATTKRMNELTAEAKRMNAGYDALEADPCGSDARTQFRRRGTAAWGGRLDIA